jgi:RNA polymerase sigma-70 factor (ECF subfamily)
MHIILLLCPNNDIAMPSSFINFSDRDLLVAEDNESAFKVLYERYWQPLYARALARLDSTLAQDVVQEIFISLWRNKERIVVEDSLSPYLFTALRYSIIKKVYREARKAVILPLSVAELDNSPVTGTDQLEYKEMQQALEGEIAILPQRMKEIYKLSRVNHLDIDEIAAQLNLSRQTVKNTLSTTLKRLRRKLSEFASVLLWF